MAAHARLHRDLAAPALPFFLNLGDEPGIADLSAAWDFDLSPHALAGFRDWLRGEYPSLDALNAQWGSAFATWEAVLPETTDAALARTDGNHSAWSDFKAWMDIVFARALRAGRDAVHGVDPALLAGIGGGQRPGWGGWDYGLLSQAVDVLETYDFDGNAAIARGLNPGLVLLSTSFLQTPAEWHRLWRQALLGMRGTIVWDGEKDIVAADGTPGPRGLASAAEFAALRGGIPAQWLAAEPVAGAVGILYSQPSFRLRWLLDRRADWQRDGASWAARGEEIEHQEDSAWRAALRRAQGALDRAGVAPRWLTPAMLAQGVPDGLRALVLPHAIALGPAEAAAIRAFAARGGVLLTDAAEPGTFDGRGQRLPVPALAGLPLRRPEVLQREAGAEPGPAAEFARLLAMAGTAPALAAEGPPDLEQREARTGAVRLLALQRGLGPEGRPLPPATVRVTPAEGWLLRHMGEGPGLAPAATAEVTLDGVRPAVLVLSPAALPGPVIHGPDQAAAGETAEFMLGLAGPSPAAATVLRIDLLDPAGEARPDRSWTLLLRGAEARPWRLPAGAAAAPGPWRLRVTELLGGTRAEHMLAVGR
nr:beta-galactosidase [Paracraurococcus ruber]